MQGFEKFRFLHWFGGWKIIIFMVSNVSRRWAWQNMICQSWRLGLQNCANWDFRSKIIAICIWKLRILHKSYDFMASCRVFGARFWEISMFTLIWWIGKTWLYACETNEIDISHLTPWQAHGGPDKLRMAPLSFLKNHDFHGFQWFKEVRISLPQPYGNLSFQKAFLT